jgi:lipid-A-disaccharide synthase-like uncharacterized protein
VDWNDSITWLAIGLLGTATFGSRFLLQWLASERAGRSYIPLAFWWLSIAGSLLLLAYAIHKRDPVFILANAPNSLIYARNLILIYRESAKRKKAGAADTTPVALVVQPINVPPQPRADAVVHGAAGHT